MPLKWSKNSSKGGLGTLQSHCWQPWTALKPWADWQISWPVTTALVPTQLNSKPSYQAASKQAITYHSSCESGWHISKLQNGPGCKLGHNIYTHTCTKLMLAVSNSAHIALSNFHPQIKWSIAQPRTKEQWDGTNTSSSSNLQSFILQWTLVSCGLNLTKAGLKISAKIKPLLIFLPISNCAAQLGCPGLAPITFNTS